MGSKTSPFCREPTIALRTRDVERLYADLRRYVTAAEPELKMDVRDVLVGLAPYYDCARRLQVDPISLFERAAASVGQDMRDTMRRFARRSDITLEAFGWRLIEAADGLCYRPD